MQNFENYIQIKKTIVELYTRQGLKKVKLMSHGSDIEGKDSEKSTTKPVDHAQKD